jgi:FtsH-binding integral membrane protein
MSWNAQHPWRFAVIVAVLVFLGTAAVLLISALARGRAVQASDLGGLALFSLVAALVGLVLGRLLGPLVRGG